MEGYFVFLIIGLCFCGVNSLDWPEVDGGAERCTGPHEYYSCGGACDNVCATLHEQSQKNCPIRNIRCNDMCYCDEGYARDANGVCVPIENC